MTIGASAVARLSAAPVNHVVQPRLLAPLTVKVSISRLNSAFATACVASIPRTALFTIGMSSGQVGSSVLRYCENVKAMAWSSFFPSKIGCWGTCSRMAMGVWNLLAISAKSGASRGSLLSPGRASSSFQPPPVMNSSACLDAALHFSGLRMKS